MTSTIGQLRSNMINRRRNIVLVTILFCLYAPLAIPFIVQGMVRVRKWAFVLWAIFMGILGMLIPPTGDFYRYAQDFYLFQGMSWDHFIDLVSLKFDFFLSFLSYGIGKVGLQVDLIRFVYNFFAYFLLGLIYVDIVRNKPLIHKRTRILMLGFFMSFTLSTFLFRFFFSMALYLYGSYLIIEKKENKGWIFIIWSILNHFAYILFAIILLVHKLPIFKLKKRTIIFLVVVFLFLGDVVVNTIFIYLPTDIVNRYSSYIDGYWAGDFLEDRSLKFRLMNLFSNCIVYVCILIYILIYSLKRTRMANWINSLLFLAIISMPFATMYGRFLIVLMWSIKILFLVNYSNTQRFRRYLRIMFVFVMISNLMGLWADRRQLSISNELRVISRPTFMLFTTQYDEQWISRNISEDGDMKKINY